ncbi:MAG: SGNH/GDSL hydrolase family protein [Nitrospira sp.]|nr:SGNH/GDSL hydrolase family protein [Nitrospira sp.]
MRVTLLRTAFTAAFLLCAVDLLVVVVGSGVSLDIVGWRLRSTTMEFPAIGLVLTGLAALVSAGKWREAVLVTGSLAGAGLAAEVILRVSDHPLSKPHVDYAAWYRPSDRFGHELVPGFEGFGPLNVPIRINDLGFRDGEHASEKPADVVRILGLGDSFLFGWGVPEDQTFLRRLEQQLARRTGRRIETINAGVPGWGLNQYYIYLTLMGRQLDPDLVVLAYFVDDLNGPLAERLAPDLQYQQGLQYKGGIFHRSRLFNFMKSLSHLVREKNRSVRVGYLHDLDLRREEWSKRPNYLMGSGDPGEQRRQIELLDRHLARLKERVDAAQATLVVLLIPDISQLRHSEVQQVNHILFDTCRRLGIPFLDMTPIFEQTDDPERFYLWPKDPHTNAAGHAEMATALERLICRPPVARQLTC